MSSMSQAVSFSIPREVQLRFLGPDDVPEVKRLCADWFPIEYPDTWYEDITSNTKFYSLAATFNKHIIGIIVCEVKLQSRCNREDADILSNHFSAATQVAYILSLGVVQDFRRHGIASLLLDSLISFLTSGDSKDCKAIYLHVLTCNSAAIRFYERRRFTQHNFLPYYYTVKGAPCDGYSYVLYINGGQPPWTPFDYIKYLAGYLTNVKPCALPHRVYVAVCNLWQRILPFSSGTHHQIRYS